MTTIHAQEDRILEKLVDAEIDPVGVLTQASNATLLVHLKGPDERAEPSRAIYKPIRGERPLVDFPPGTLAGREVAAYLISRAGGWNLVPPTVLRDGPWGPGSVQAWVEQEEERLTDPSAGLVEILTTTDYEESGMLAVVTGADEDGEEVVVAHADDPELRSMAVLDVVLNNADRKAAHLTLDRQGSLRGFDHGLCLHTQEKLRTVLWGWAGQEVPPTEVERLARLRTALTDDALGNQLVTELDSLIQPAEVQALLQRVEDLLQSGRHPEPPNTRYPLPWPLW